MAGEVEVIIKRTRMIVMETNTTPDIKDVTSRIQNIVSTFPIPEVFHEISK